MNPFNYFLLGFIFGGIVVGIIIEKTRRPTVIQNEIGKIKKNDGPTDVHQEMEIEDLKPRRKFLGIFKRKKQ